MARRKFQKILRIGDSNEVRAENFMVCADGKFARRAEKLFTAAVGPLRHGASHDKDEEGDCEAVQIHRHGEGAATHGRIRPHVAQ
ncbi:MAG: hypothetical protein LBH53_01425 [Puniceicoccales bacterium]|nr:hypothetical protein [Puniceicoccales bacterium]